MTLRSTNAPRIVRSTNHPRRTVSAATVALALSFACQQAPVASTQARPPILAGTGTRSGNVADSVALRFMHGVSLSEPNAFNHPLRLDWSDSSLVVLDRKTNPEIQVLSPTSGRRLASFGQEGDPYWKGAWTASGVPGVRDSIVVFDATTRIAWVIALSDPTASTGRQISFGKQSRLTEIRGLANGGFVGTGFLPVSRYALFDSRGRLTKAFGDIPAWSDSAPFEVRQQAYLANMITNPSGTRIATATQYGDRIEILGEDGTVIAPAERPRMVEPAYAVVRPANGRAFMAQVPETRQGYIALAASERHIFALWSGRTRSGSGPPASSGKTVFAFSWGGRHEGTLVLDRDANAIAVDATEGNLYALATQPLPTLMKYNLRDRGGVVDNR